MDNRLDRSAEQADAMKPRARSRPNAGVELSRHAHLPAFIDPRWQTFLQAASEGSLSKAAAALDMPQSMVSRHIGQLEEACGERLFNRTGRGVSLTEFGQLLLPRVTRLALDVESIADDIRSFGGQPVGEVMVGLLPFAVRRFAGPLYAAVHTRLPGVRIHLVEGASSQLEAQLREGRLDMALVLREADQPPGDEPVMVRVPLQLVCPRDHPLVRAPVVSLEQLAGVPLVVPARPHPLRARLDRLAAERALDLRVVAEADSVGLQCEVVAAGGGYAIASVLAEQLDRRLVAIPIVNPVLERLVVLSESIRRPATRATRAVRQLISGLSEAGR